MDPKHKDILIRNRVELVENLNVSDGLFSQLIAKKIFNARMVRTIQVILEYIDLLICIMYIESMVTLIHIIGYF